MGCDFPIKAYRSEEFTPGGKAAITFNPLKARNSTSPFEIPCGRCTGCRLDKSFQWSVRMMHEGKMWPSNCFVTLTYDDQAVPSNYSLELRPLQLFIKRLRKSLSQRIRFFACGEYGDTFGRPHYHAIIFNHNFHDRIKHSYNSDTSQYLYTSTSLSNLWQLGHCTVGDLTHQSAGYVARYTTKKIYGSDECASAHYYRVSPIDGQWHQVKPEFAVMSRRPGIGSTWFDEYRSDVFPSGFVIVDGQRRPVPRFYKLKLEEHEQTQLKRQSRKASLKYKDHNTTERRWARVAVRDDRVKTLKRGLK